MDFFGRFIPNNWDVFSMFFLKKKREKMMKQHPLSFMFLKKLNLEIKTSPDGLDNAPVSRFEFFYFCYFILI